jgi:hypothetical protein
MENQEEIIIKKKHRSLKISYILLWLIILILFSFSFFISCVTSPSNDSADSYLFIEILRNTYEKALNDSCVTIFIEHCPYTYNSNTKVLNIDLAYYSIIFDTLGTSNFVIANNRTITGDRWSGDAGWIFSIYDFPCSKSIIYYPLPSIYKDTIKIENHSEDGSVEYEYNNIAGILKINNEWKYSQESDINYNLGSYHIKDEVVIKNHGWLKKSNVVLQYNNSWSKHNEKEQSFFE